MPVCGDIALGTIASYARSRMKILSYWFSPLGIEDRFISGDSNILQFKAVASTNTSPKTDNAGIREIAGTVSKKT